MQVLIFEITCEIIVFTYATCHNFYSLFAAIIPLKMELIPSHFLDCVVDIFLYKRNNSLAKHWHTSVGTGVNLILKMLRFSTQSTSIYLLSTLYYLSIGL